MTAATLMVCFMAMLTTKMWGRSRHFTEYQHAFFSAEAAKLPVIFQDTTGLSRADAEALLNGNDNLYLEVAFTQDQILVLPLKKFDRAVRYYNLADVKNDVLDVDQLAPFLKKDRKFILKLMENTRAEHEVFVENMQKMGLEKSQNFLVMSDYEAPLKALKELAPAYVYGSTKPEVLKIVAMQSMYLLEAVSFRADALVQPLELRNQEFFNQEILSEMKRRFVKIIVGPVGASEVPRAQQLNPFGIIISRR
ncbi:MAG: hypothetical protein K0R29_1499 [Pseudobdellovibrio sp.]|nr:hypothetical protein [Pseudobdellovibrio sp.]